MIRWITSSLGTAPWTGTDDVSGYRRLDVRLLADSAGNSPAVVAGLLREGLSLLRSGVPLVVACHFGMSRSNAVAAGLLALSEDGPFLPALARVAQVTGEQQIHPAVIAVVEDAVVSVRGEVATGIPLARDGILVTGGHGFIGTRLVTALRAEHRVVSPRRDELDVERQPLELNLLLRQERIGVIVHLAFPRKIASNSSMGEALVQLKNVLDAARVNGCRVIVPGGWVVYAGYHTAEMLADEMTPLRPKDTYGQTRVLCEALVNLARLKTVYPIHLIRMSPVYGPGSNRPALFSSCLEKIQRDEPVATHRFSNGEPRLDYLFVDDAVGALVALVKFEGRQSEDFNVGGGRLISTREVAMCLRSLAGKEGEITSLPMDDWIGNIQMDSGKFSTATGWHPAISFEVGIQALFEWQSQKRRS